MGVAALLAGLIVIIVILGFVTSLQNRSSKPGRGGRGRKHNPQPFEDEFNAEEKHSPYHHKKSAHHENGPQRQHENDTARQQVSTHHKDHYKDRSEFSESHRHHE